MMFKALRFTKSQGTTGKNKMPEIIADNISIINSDELEGATRLEAEYYQPAYLSLIKSLKRISTVKLSTIAFVTDGIHASIDYDDSSPIYCLSAKTMIAVSQHNNNLRTSIQCGDVIISSMGTIGFSAVAYKEMLPANAVRQVLIVRVKELEKLDSDYPYFISTFLNSKYGMFQSIREATGNVQQHLFIDKVINFKIPQLLNIEYIGGIYKKAEIKFIESNNLYSQTESLLLEELGIKDIDLSHEPCYEVNSADTISANRIDAEYYQPKYERVIEAIRKNNHKLLTHFIEEYSTGYPFSSKSYLEKGIPLIRINNIQKGQLGLQDVVYIKESDINLSPRDVVITNDIVISMSGTIGASAVIDEFIGKAIINQRILKIRLKDIDADYLCLVLNSIIGSMQFNRIGTGGVQTNISYKDMKNILIPLCNKQLEIANLIRQSHSSRRHAKGLLEKAKRRVEEMIEKG